MNFSDYSKARLFLETIGEPFTYLMIITVFSLIVLSFSKKYYIYTRYLVLTTTSILFVGFLLIAWFHLKIYNTITIYNPTNNNIAGRYLVPLWIENEKLYFWGLILGLLSSFINRNQNNQKFNRCLNIVFGLFVLLVSFVSNPFKSPLPMFHQEITYYYNTISGGNWQTKLQAFNNTYGRMVYYYNSAYMWIHPPLLFISYAALSISFLGSIFMLIYKYKKLYDKITYNYGKFGYLFLTAGILISYPWAISAWKNEPWWWSPKINMSLMTWVLYTAYLHSRLYLNRKNMWNTTAIIGILCFLVLIFTYLTTYLIPGVHSYG